MTVLELLESDTLLSQAAPGAPPLPLQTETLPYQYSGEAPTVSKGAVSKGAETAAGAGAPLPPHHVSLTNDAPPPPSTPGPPAAEPGGAVAEDAPPPPPPTALTDTALTTPLHAQHIGAAAAERADSGALPACPLPPEEADTSSCPPPPPPPPGAEVADDGYGDAPPPPPPPANACDASSGAPPPPAS